MAENAIKDILKDILKHTHGLGIFEMVKITGDLEKTVVEAVDLHGQGPSPRNKL